MTNTNATQSSCDEGAPTCMLVTVGCAKNEVDTDRMRALLIGAGYDEVEDPQQADAIIVNTCSFLGIATQESVETVLSLAEVGRANGHAKIIMCGCVPSRYGDEIVEEMPEVDAFVNADDEDKIVTVVSSLLHQDADVVPGENVAWRTVEGASAYVKISDGCDRWCTFCAIPSIRGAYSSRAADDILREVCHLMEGGVREIVLVGQDTGVWGEDLEPAHDLAWLLEEVARVVRPYHGWVRVLYLQPEGMTERLVRVLRDVDEVLPYIDIPVQHCSAHILSSMGRSGSREELLELFARLRKSIPGLVLRTTGLVGFPGETIDEFEELCEFIEEVGFDYTSVFGYSAEEGTVAATLPAQIDDAEIVERTQRLQDVAERLGFAATARYIGKNIDVLIDGVEDNGTGVELIGHAWFQAPDSDGAVHIEEGDAAVGDIVRCTVTDAFCYELVGVIDTPIKGE